MTYSVSARSVLAGVAAAGVLFAAGCTGSTHHTKTADPASSTTTPSAAGSGASSANGSPTTGKIGRTKSSPSPGAPTYPTPGKQPDLNPDQAGVLKSLPGSASATCAVVGSHTDVRSGSIAVGNFVVARKNYSSTVATSEVPEVFLYVIPQNAKGMRSVTVTIDPTSAAGPTQQITSKSVQQAETWSYFAVNIPVHAPGGYRLTMVSGANKGCFDVSFAK